MDKTLKKLLTEVGQGNPGAMTVIAELQYFSKWTEILKTAKKHGYVGGKLWELYKNKYGTSTIATGKHLQQLPYHRRRRT